MNKNPKTIFSCVVPSIGRRELFYQCLPSLCAQISRFDEIVVAFDIPEIEELDFSLPEGTSVVTTGGNQGGPAARKVGYEKSNGDYVFFLDDDDYVDPYLLKEVKQHIVKLDKKPDAVFTRLVKKWTAGNLPQRTTKPPLPVECFDTSVKARILRDWSGPYTSSGIFLRKKSFPCYPANVEIKGFNDIQIKRSIEAQDASVSYCKTATTFFIQDLKNWRMTSDLFDRIENLRTAEAKGMEFTLTQGNSIILSSMCSSVRTVAFTQGIASAIKAMFRGHRTMRSCGFRPNMPHLLIKYAETLVLILWLGIQRRKDESSISREPESGR